MMRLVAVMAAVAGASAAAVCDAAYQCKYHYETDTDLWFWDLSSLCKPGTANEPGYYTSNQANAGADKFFFNICGMADYKCFPLINASDIPVTGVAVQITGTGGNDCALAGEGAPIFTPLDPSNPATGGISVLHHAAPIQNSDGRKCYPANGIEVNRRITFNISCDPNVNTLIAGETVEGPECNYVTPITSKYGCGKIYDGPDSQAAANKEAAERGAEAGAVIGFMVLGAVLFVGGWIGIHFYRHKELPFSIPGVGNLASGPAPAGSGFSGTTGSGFGSSAASGSYTSTA